MNNKLLQDTLNFFQTYNIPLNQSNFLIDLAIHTQNDSTIKHLKIT